MVRHKTLAPLALLSAGILLAGCAGGDADSPDDDADSPDDVAETTTLTFANSFTDDHPHNRCGAIMIADEINAMDVGLQIDVFSNSSLGPDAERVSSLIAGDIDLDLQGPSAISAAYEPIGVLDSAYAFTGADHLFEFFDSGAADQLKDGLLEATGLRTIQPYFFGMRNFSANSAIRTPEDLEGLRMRFPDTPAYLANAQALGAEAVPVAFEELFLALQQGIVDGQENPIPTVKSMSLDEVQSHVSLSEHHTGVQLLVVNEDRWQSLSSEQQDALNSVIATNRDVNRACIDEEQQEIVEEWEETGAVELVTDVDRAAFAAKAEAFWLDRYTGDELAIYEAIRSSAPE